MLKILLLVFIASCAGGQAVTVKNNRPVYHYTGIVKHQYDVKLLLISELKKKYGVDLSRVQTLTRWVEKKSCHTGRSGFVWKSKCYGGLHFSCTDIYVYRRKRISRSSYAHELAHCYGTIIHGRRDPKHTSDIWEVVKLVNKKAYKNGW